MTPTAPSEIDGEALPDISTHPETVVVGGHQFAETLRRIKEAGGRATAWELVPPHRAVWRIEIFWPGPRQQTLDLETTAEARPDRGARRVPAIVVDALKLILPILLAVAMYNLRDLPTVHTDRLLAPAPRSFQADVLDLWRLCCAPVGPWRGDSKAGRAAHAERTPDGTLGILSQRRGVAPRGGRATGWPYPEAPARTDEPLASQARAWTVSKGVARKLRADAIPPTHPPEKKIPYDFPHPRPAKPDWPAVAPGMPYNEP